MKKLRLIFLAVLLSFCAEAFAQTAKYTDFMKKAKTAESNKEWAYAMGYYLDAIAEDPEDKNGAFDRLNLIYDSIKSGNPGYRADGSKWSPFDLYEDWKNLLINTEKYFTEYCPYNFNIGKLEMGVPDYTNKTAEYKALIVPENSYRFNVIMNAVYEGYNTSYSSNWQDLPAPEGRLFSYYDVISAESNVRKIPAYALSSRTTNKVDCGWPIVSASKIAGAKKVKWTSSKNISGEDYPLVKNNSSYINNGAAVYAIPQVLEEWGYNSTTKKEGYINVEYGNIEYFNPWFFYTNSRKTKYSRIMYDLKVKIVDEKGNVIAAAKRFMPCSPNSYDSSNDNDYSRVSFSGITQAQMALIDSGKAWVEIESVNLQYGFQNFDDYSKYDSRKDNVEEALTFKKNLPELKIPLEKCTVTNELTGAKDKIAEAYINVAVRNFIRSAYYGKETKAIQNDYEQTIIPFTNFSVLVTRGLYDYQEDEYTRIPVPYGIKENTFNDWQAANILSELYGLPHHYDETGNVINDEGFAIESTYRTYIYSAYRKLTQSELDKIFNEKKTLAESYIKANKEKITQAYSWLEYDSSRKEYDAAENAVKNIKSMEEGISEKNTAKVHNAYEEVKDLDVEAIVKAGAEVKAHYDEVIQVYDLYHSRYENALKYLGENNSDVKTEKYCLKNITDYLEIKNLKAAESNTVNLKNKESVFAATDSEVQKAEQVIPLAPQFYEEKSSYLEELKLILGEVYCNRSNTFKNYSNYLEYLKHAVDRNSLPDIYKYYSLTESYDISSLETAVENKKAELHSQLKTLIQKDKALLESAKDYAPGTSLESDIMSMYAKIISAEQYLELYSAKELALKNTEIESLAVEETVSKMKEEKAVLILKEYGFTLTKYTGTLDVFNYQVFSTERKDADIYSIKITKKSAASKTKIKDSDYFFFPISRAAKDVGIRYSEEIKVPTWQDFIEQVLESKKTGHLTVTYMHKSLGSYDAYQEEMKF